MPKSNQNNKTMSTYITIAALSVTGALALAYLCCAFSYNLGWREGYDHGLEDGYAAGHRDGSEGEPIDPEDRWSVVEGLEETPASADGGGDNQ
jgi:hypothetical protein